MQRFEQIYKKACGRFLNKEALEKALPTFRTEQALAGQSDDRYLSEMSRRVFRAGLKHAMVDAKWPAFEDAFHRFDPARVVMMSDEQLEAVMRRDDIIRHWGKLKTIRHNAQFILDIAREHGSFGAWLAAWPVDDIVGLWDVLKKRGAHLGGNSGPAFLRMVGKDTFLLTDDVVAALRTQRIVSQHPASKRDLRAVQQAFNQWREESGRPLCHISRILSYTIG